jgi:hypothetical protein
MDPADSGRRGFVTKVARPIDTTAASTSRLGVAPFIIASTTYVTIASTVPLSSMLPLAHRNWRPVDVQVDRCPVHAFIGAG